MYLILHLLNSLTLVRRLRYFFFLLDWKLLMRRLRRVRRFFHKLRYSCGVYAGCGVSSINYGISSHQPCGYAYVIVNSEGHMVEKLLSIEERTLLNTF